MPFVDFLKKLVPPWLQQTRWGAYLGGLGGELDSASTRTKDGVKARFPSTDYAAKDTLDAIAGERQLPRGTPYSGGKSTESDSSLAARLLDAWNRWCWGGTALGLLRALKQAGYPNAVIGIVTNTTVSSVVRGREYTLDGGGNLVVTLLPVGSWLLAPTRLLWNRFVVFFEEDVLPATPVAPSDWGSALPADDSDEINALRDLIRKWRPAHAACAGICVVLVGRCWDDTDDLTWDTQPGTWSGNTVHTYEVD